MNKVQNVIFYRTTDKKGNTVDIANLFYTDGTVRKVSSDEGYEAVQAIAKEENIRNVAELKEMMQTEGSRIRTMSKKEFVKNFDSFIVKKELTKDDIREAIANGKINFNEDAFKEAENIKLNAPEYEEEFEENKEGFFKRIYRKAKESKLGTKVAVAAIALALCCGLYSCANKNTKTGQMTDSNIVSQDTMYQAVEKTEFESLLERTNNITQKETMKLISENLDYFNGEFADHYIEEGKDIRAALSWDEMMALQLAYNNYSKEQIRAIFNGAEIDSAKYDGYYKNATLQLMGAYVLETRDYQVNSYKYVVSEEGQEFVKKYNEMFLAAKEASGQEKIDLVNKFYTELHKDFPISDDIREVGISHADARKELKQYKLAITPIVAASEILFQNLDIDHTLSDKAIDYFNDLGLCNLAVEQFERAETILLGSNCCDKENTNPLYEEFREAKIKELTAKNIYVIDDAHRDLSQLDYFKLVVNKQVNCFGQPEKKSSGKKSSGKYKSTTEKSTRTEVNTTFESIMNKFNTKDREEAIRRAGEDQVRRAEEEENRRIEEENQRNKEQAEKDAEKLKEERQKQADEDAKQKEKEVEESNKDLQDKIDDANNNINNGGTTNENDFGDHNVQFDDDKKDDNGNLDDSIKDITTDPTDAKTQNDLPDPNKTGAAFDARSVSSSNTSTSSNTNTNTSTSSNTNTSSNTASSTSSQSFYTEEVNTNTSSTKTTTTSKQHIIEYEEPVKTNAQIVEEYINSLENQSNNDTNKSLTK